MRSTIKKACFLLVLVLVEKSGSGQTLASNPGAGRDLSGPRKVIEPEVREKQALYPVAGTCEVDLEAQMAQKATCSVDGRKYDSQVSWRVGWKYGHARSADSCSPESFRLIVDITTSMPSWVDRERAPEPLAHKWDVYVDSLGRHEDGHRDRVYQAVRDLNQAIAALPPARSCTELDREVQRICRHRLARLAEEQDGYDMETVHGRTQGALFP